MWGSLPSLMVWKGTVLDGKRLVFQEKPIKEIPVGGRKITLKSDPSTAPSLCCLDSVSIKSSLLIPSP